MTDYAPQTNVACPDIATTPLLRVFTPQNQSLHPDEVEYIANRSSGVIANAWQSWVGNGSALGYNLSEFAEGDFSKIGIAISGGGYRAALYGAGVLSGLDSRNASSLAAGTGGLLQVASYLAGLSGAFVSPGQIVLRGADDSRRGFVAHWILVLQQLAHSTGYGVWERREHVWVATRLGLGYS